MVDVCLPAVSGTLCLVPRNRSENKQEAVFLPGGIRDDFMGEEIFKEREKHGEKSPGRMIKHSQKSGSPPPPALARTSLVHFRDSQGGRPRHINGKPPAKQILALLRRCSEKNETN